MIRADVAAGFSSYPDFPDWRDELKTIESPRAE